VDRILVFRERESPLGIPQAFKRKIRTAPAEKEDSETTAGSEANRAAQAPVTDFLEG